MRLFVTLMAYVALAAPAFAAPPREISEPVDAVVNILVGEVKFFQFAPGIVGVEIPLENVVSVSPRTETDYRFEGIRDGAVTVTFRASDGHEVSRMHVIVGAHSVKIYGTGADTQPELFSCDRLGCVATGPVPPRPTGQSVTVRTPTGNGGFIERSKTFQ